MKRDEAPPPPAGMVGSIQPMPADLLAQTAPIGVEAGKIVEFYIRRDAVLAASVSGRAAKVYWTTAHEMTSMTGGERERLASMFVEGVQAGKATLYLELVGDRTQKVAVEVR
jgi:hypothetical protein